MQDRIPAYLARLGLEVAPSLDAEGLLLLQAAHRRAITFENLDVMLGRGIRIGADDVFAKLVEGGRGGYCFEQNRLFADMLGALGLPTRPLLARVLLRLPDDSTPPRTHVLLLAHMEGRDWIADVGFGGADLPLLPLEDGASATTPDGSRHRLRRVSLPEGEWLLERAGARDTTDGRALEDEGWQAQYTFDLAHVEQADLDQANHWTSTWPQSRFVLMPLATRVLPQGFAGLAGTSLSIADGKETRHSEIGNAKEWRAAMQDVFGISLSAEEVEQLQLFG